MNIFLGYDHREHEAYEVACKSILKRTKGAVITPLCLNHLPMLTRPIEKRGKQLWCPVSNAPMATEFAISRFAVPLIQTKGFALFADSDILLRADIAELFSLAKPQYAVQVVKHNHEPAEKTKMNGLIQTIYPRKNWSSVILWNCDHPANKRLTWDALNTLPGRDLHRFYWLDDAEIGELPSEWNYLVGVDRSDWKKAKLLHYTLGGHWIKGWKGTEADGEWLKESKQFNGIF